MENNNSLNGVVLSETGTIQWDTIFNAIGHPAIILDRGHRIVAANSASVRLTGKPQAEIIGKYCYEVFHHIESEAPAAGCPMEKMLHSGVMESVDMEIEALDGIFLVSCTPILAADGTIDKVIHIATDISARKEMEHKLVNELTEHKRLEDLHNQSRQDWEETFHSINDAITIIDNDYNIIRANKASEELLHVPMNELTSQKCYKSYHGLEHPMPQCPTCQTLVNGQSSSGECFESHLGKYLELKAFPRIGPNGERKGIIHIVRDITEKKKAELALLEQQNFTKSLIRNSTVALFVLDKNHQVQVWNRACEYLTGCSHAEMLGSKNHWKAFYMKKQPTLADVVMDGDFDRLPKLYTHVSRSLHNTDGYKAEGWFAQVNGKDRYFMIEAAPIYDNQGEMTHVLETISDLTDSKSLEEQLLQAQKMESIGHLSGGIAHEFNNILAVILGYGQVMRKGFEPDSINMKDLDQIMTAAERAAVLTKGLLAFSRKQHVSLKNIDLNILVHTTLKSFSRILGDDIIINEYLDAAPLMVYADQSQVTQVLMNLMANARDAMPNGGELEIRSKYLELSEPYSTLHCSIPPGKYAHLTLSDSGNGIDEKNIRKIFEPFFTTKDIGKGTGLGLSVVYGIISQHNGFITVSSVADHGTVFDLYIPLVEKPTSTRTVTERSADLKGGDETILLADDEPVLLSMFCSVLSELGYHVITATDGVDAVEKFVANRNKINLLILDVQMCKKSGLQAYREIKLLNPECRALFISGFNEEQFHGDMALEAGTELLTKPFTPVELAAGIRKMLDVVK